LISVVVIGVLQGGELVVLETTVPPGTTEQLIRGWLEEESGLRLGEFYLAHSPERIMTGLSISRLQEFPKIVGGVDGESGQRALQLYSHFIPNMHLVSSARVAEMVKVMEGCYRDVNIALANELFKISETLGIDFYEARESALHQYCHIHMPSTGVGGHCIPVYPWFLVKEMEKRELFGHARLIRAAREQNEEMIGYWAQKIILQCLQINKPLQDVRICLQGITYREGVKGLYHSRNLALARLLQEKGLSVFVCDELFSGAEIRSLGLKTLNPEDADVVFDCFYLNFGRKESCVTEIRPSGLSSQPIMKSC
jgi:UDP-N-acetyl-D-mannosaminuronic acid dehydrogenase